MKKFTLLVGILLLAVPPLVGAADWPQWRGPDRTDISKETGLLKVWPKEGPKLLWSYKEAGNGYSGFAVVGTTAYTMGGVDGKDEFVLALDTTKGTKLWSVAVGPFVGNNWGGGPRCTPTVDGDSLYAMSSGGVLVCLEARTGKKVWSKSLSTDLGGRKPNWNWCESPLVDGDQVVVTPGGKGTVTALDKKTGAVKWASEGANDSAGYSSIIIGETDGTRIYIQQTMSGVLGIDAKTGKVLWSIPRPKYRTAVIPTPIYADNAVYVTSGYNAGCTLISLSDGGSKAKVTYENSTIVNQHGGVVKVGDYIYGHSDGGGWTCQNFKTGDSVWKSRNLDKGSLTCVGDRLYCYGEDSGTCALVEVSKEGWQEHGRFTLPEKSKIRSRSGKFWTHPVVANGKLLLRDQDLIFCYDVKDGK